MTDDELLQPDHQTSRDESAGGTVHDPAGTPFERYCGRCDEITIHNSHWRCIECFQANGRPESGSDE